MIKKKGKRYIDVSIGICAYNEEAIIGKLLDALLKQRLDRVRIKEIIVVSSASTDKTDTIVRKIAKRDKRVKLVVQKERKGKANAINEFLKRAKYDICIVSSGDVVPEVDTIEKIIKPFMDSKVGMSGGRPVPVNDMNTFWGFIGHLLWEVHHNIALKNPKLGEMIAFRKVFDSIPNNTAVDEAAIEAKIIEAGLKKVYVSDAIIRNKSPENLKDFLKQRRRIYSGHIHLKKTSGYKVSSMGISNIFPINLSFKITFKRAIWVVAGVVLEMIGRLLGMYDFYIKKKNPVVWDIAKSTKKM